MITSPSLSVFVAYLILFIFPAVYPFQLHRGAYYYSRHTYPHSSDWEQSSEFVAKCNGDRQYVKYRTIIANQISVKVNKLSQVEDDGYSLSRGKKSFWKTLISKLLLRPQKAPGNLILIRHGESDLNYNKTFTGTIPIFILI